MKRVTRKGRKFSAPTAANQVNLLIGLITILTMAIIISCSDGESLPDLPPPEEVSSSSAGGDGSSSSGNGNLIYCRINDSCDELSIEVCRAFGGTPVKSCSVVLSSSSGDIGGSSSSGIGENDGSSSSSESGDLMYCLVGGVCPDQKIPSGTCIGISGTPMENCPVASSSSSSGAMPSSSSNIIIPPPPGTGGPVSVYGALKACATTNGKGRICGSGAYANTPVQVKGVSLFWSNTGWGGERFFSSGAVNPLVDNWKAEIIRAPLGYADHEDANNAGFGGYKDDASNWDRVKAAVDAARAKGVYVIVDFHSHNAETYTDLAKTFFETTVAAYHNDPHVIFEIYNEPIDQSWSTIKTYAETIIGALRAKGANNLVLVGTPKYSVNPKAANGNYLSDDNVAYVFHFYAAEHSTTGTNWADNSTTYSSNVTAVIDAGKPIFVSEYGTVMANGNGTHSATNSNAWHTFMDTHKISSCAWSVNDKAEGASFFSNGVSMSSLASTSYMTSSGSYIYNMLRTWADSAPWRGGSMPSSSSTGGDTQVFYCDYGPVTQYGGGCTESTEPCDTKWGWGVSSCSNKLYCNWGPHTIYGGGCSYIESTSDCKASDGGSLTTFCPRAGFCADHYNKSCIFGSDGYTASDCAKWAIGDYEILSSCPAGWNIYQ